MDNARLLAFLLFVVAPGAVLGLLFERRRRRRSPETKPFLWGYFYSVSCLLFGVLGLGILVATPFLEETKNAKDDSLLGCVLMVCCWGVPGFFAIRRRAWAWAFITVFGCNPIIWLANYRYGKNRWAEFAAEKPGSSRITGPLAAAACFAPLMVLVVWSNKHDANTKTQQRPPPVTNTGKSAPGSPSAIQRGSTASGFVPRLRDATALGTASAALPTVAQEKWQLIPGNVLHYNIALPPGWEEDKIKSAYDLFYAYKDTLWLGVIAEEIEVQTSKAADTVVTNLKEHYSAEPTISERTRVLIDNRTWLSFTADAEVEGARCRFLYYVYGGPEGTYQIVTCTTTNIFPRYEPLLESIARSFQFPVASNP